MLKFLQVKIGDSGKGQANRPALRYRPEMVYGHTQESPLEFVNRHTVYFDKTAHQDKLPKVKAEARKSQMSHFNLTRGEFSTFLDRHKHYGSIGNLHKKKASMEVVTKQSWNNSCHTESNVLTNTIEKASNPRTSIGRQSTLNHSQSTTWASRSNSVSIFEKAQRLGELREQRDTFVGKIQEQARERREKERERFGLPRVGPNHELVLMPRPKAVKDMKRQESEELFEQIDKFQNALFCKFK